MNECDVDHDLTRCLACGEPAECWLDFVPSELGMKLRTALCHVCVMDPEKFSKVVHRIAVEWRDIVAQTRRVQIRHVNKSKP